MGSRNSRIYKARPKNQIQIKIDSSTNVMNFKNFSAMKIISAVLLMLLVLPVLYFHPISVFADEDTVTTPIPALATPMLEVIEFDVSGGISALIKVIIDWAFKLAGVLAFSMILFAGFQYLTSGGNTAQQKDAQERITSAIIGLILLFAFYIILYTINPDILREPRKPPSTDLPATDSSDDLPVNVYAESVQGKVGSCDLVKISKECSEDETLQKGECIAGSHTTIKSNKSEGENGWTCEFKGNSWKGGTCHQAIGTIKIYCIPVSSEASTSDETLSGNLVNITAMGIPINVNTFGQSKAYLDSALADKLLSLKNIKPKWWVNDACIDAECSSTSYSPRDPDDCHLDGTCVDIDSTSNSAKDNKKIIAIFNKAGLDVLEESDHLHVALPTATGHGSYPGSDYCITEKECWYGAG